MTAKSSTDKIALPSCDWALRHAMRFGDTDIFPVPFEYAAINNDWACTREFLSNVDLSNYNTRATSRYLVPKPGISFRVAHQLDPLDQLIYTAMVHEVCDAIEESRVSRDLRVACSYRVNLDADGKFFSDDSGWTDYQSHSEDLAGRVSCVITADISDFYNQVSQHRIKNALEMANVDETRSENIEQFLSLLGAKQSQGIPVGPSASIILAEACLHDVDTRLMGDGIVHTRYVDDFRIFCMTRKECLSALHELTDYLYTVHRLPLQPSKTKLRASADFVKYVLRDPAKVEDQKKHAALNRMIDEIYEVTGYFVELDDLPPADINEAVRKSLHDMLSGIVNEKTLRIGPARHVLRRAKSLRTRELLPTVLANLEKLSPVFRDVCEYLIAIMPQDVERARHIGDALISFARDSDKGHLAFLRLWILHLFHVMPQCVEQKVAFDLAMDSSQALGLRPLALLARSYRNVPWVRGYKEKWQGLGDWDRRAVIYAGSILPKDERGPWLSMIKKSKDPIDRAVAIWASK